MQQQQLQQQQQSPGPKQVPRAYGNDPAPTRTMCIQPMKGGTLSGGAMLPPDVVVFTGNAKRTLSMEMVPGWECKTEPAWRSLKPDEVRLFL